MQLPHDTTHTVVAHIGGRDPLEVTMTLKVHIERYSAKQTEQTARGKEGEGKRKRKKL